jgi:hypothetical protein
MTAILRLQKPAKGTAGSSRKAKAKRPARSVSRRPSKVLAAYNKWMESNVDLVMEVARKNTLRLIGDEVF